MDYDDDGPSGYMAPSGNSWKREADRLRDAAQRICTLLYESSQDGENLGTEQGSSWNGDDGARRWAERVKSTMAKVSELSLAAFPDDDPETLAGAYGDGYDAMLNVIARLTQERNDARSKVALLNGYNVGHQKKQAGLIEKNRDLQDALTVSEASVERMNGVCREAAQRLRSLSNAPNHGPKSILDHVADLERDALARGE